LPRVATRQRSKSNRGGYWWIYEYLIKTNNYHLQQQSINQHHKVNFIFAARRQHVKCSECDDGGFTWFYKYFMKTVFESNDSHNTNQYLD